ncbi:MAG: ABC-F family ATP-binding cassette domain-containing protein [Gemmatimonadota bacterium]|jgi:ATP-binding cassette subfamily F protein uup|nr:ABC-F family ATP-binding cassette domain-containing protein [Gemmatimonadota bacterium]
MPVLTIKNLTKSIGSRTLFREVSLGVEEGEKIGFIGPNGAGKSTLFSILAGLDQPDTGTLSFRRGGTIGFLPQEPVFPAGMTIRDAVSAGRPEMVEALAGYHAISVQLTTATGDEAERLLTRQGERMARIEALGGWEWQHEIETILSHLGIPDSERVVDALSGGERKRVALARVLLDAPDLLILDEPTNHLDADTTLWLEERLLAYQGAVLLVTHDRYFLDRVVTRMVEIEGQAFNVFEGGYTEYLEQKAEREARRAVENAKRDRLIEQELAWVRRSPSARTGKQKARIDRLEAVRAQADANRPVRQEAEFSFGPPPRLGRTILELDHVSKSFAGRPLFRDLTTLLRGGERIGIVGPNGAGKTTLLRVILGETAPDSGEVRFGVNTLPAYFDQARAHLDPSRSVYESVADEDWVEFGGKRVHLRSYLERFLFPTATHEQRVGSLSGGERNRLLIAKLLLQEANLLILDEPTNDLDLQTLRVLESALAEFGGCVLVVTHDRFFLDKVATGLLVFESDGEVRRHEGGYDLYRRLREEDRKAAAPAATGSSPKTAGQAGGKNDKAASSTATARPRRLSNAERRELAAMEERILEAETKRDELGALLADPSLYVEKPDQVASARTRFEEAGRAVEALYERWTELEALSSGGN